MEETITRGGIMLVKLGVDISKLKHPIRKKLTAINGVVQKYGYEAIVSSTYEGTHSPGSFHYANLAIDLRTRLIRPEHVNSIVLDLRSLLGPDYDVVLERDHIHIEYDPKEV